MNATTLTSNSAIDSASDHVPPSEARRMHDFRTGPQYSPDGLFYRSGFNEAWTPVPTAPKVDTGAAILEHLGAKSRTVYVVLALLLGGFGIHNFYAGRTGIAITQLLIMLFSLATSFLLVPILFMLAIAFWAFLDAICVDRDGTGRKMR